MITYLGPTSLRILGYLLEARQNHRAPPSWREIMTRSGLKSTNSVYEHIERLRKAGLVDDEGPATHRSLCPTCQLIQANRQIGQGGGICPDS